MSPVTRGTNPADSRLSGYLPPGVLAQQQRAREAEDDLKHWRAYDLQWQVFHRLRQFSVNHASQSWQRRYCNPLAPYALAFVFTQPITGATEGASRIAVAHAATRLWKAGPESRQPIPLLASLTEQARGRDPCLLWDLRQEIAHRSDEGMADDAVYLGLGLSSLDTKYRNLGAGVPERLLRWTSPAPSSTCKRFGHR